MDGWLTCVQDTVDKGNVDGDEEKDGLADEHLDRAVERPVEDTLERPV